MPITYVLDVFASRLLTLDLVFNYALCSCVCVYSRYCSSTYKINMYVFNEKYIYVFSLFRLFVFVLVRNLNSCTYVFE